MRVSVIIPFYNNYKTISKTLDSLVQQFLPIYEVIIVDDCSSDEKEVNRVLNPYRKVLPIQLLRNEQNKNGAYSRNRGILVSKGEIISFLDADDTWASNKTLRIKECINEHGAENLFFSKVKFKINGKLDTSRPEHFNSKVHISEYLFLEDGFIQTSSIFCSSEIAKSVLFQEQFKRHQDYDFVLRAYDKGIKFQFIPEELTTYISENKVNLSKGESYSYSKAWVDEMRVYFSEDGYQGFQIFNLTARLLAEKRFIKAGTNVVKGLMGLNIANYPRIYAKLKRSIKGIVKSI